MKKKVVVMLLLFTMVSAVGCGKSVSDISDVSGSAEASGDVSYTQMISYETSDREEKRDDAFAQKVSVNGKTYRLKDVDYRVLDESKEMKTVTQNINSETYFNDDTYVPEQSYEADGVTYTLSGISKVVVDGAYTQDVSGYDAYDHAVTSADVPQTKDITVKNEKTGEEQTVICQFTGISDRADTWESTHIDITFQDYSANLFAWNNMLVSKNDAEPGLDEKQLLASVGAEPSRYQVQSIHWSGQPYEQGGILYRNARAEVLRLVDWKQADYRGQIVMPGTVYTATYTAQVPADDVSAVYKIQATGNYVRDYTKLVVLGASVGIAVLAVLIIAILFAVAKKRKEKDGTDGKQITVPGKDV